MFLTKQSRAGGGGGGFGLIELLVSISIMLLVTTIVLANHDAFNSGALLRSQAYEVALRLREVQLSAVGARADGTADFRSLYGVWFDPADGDSYITFSTPNTTTSGWEGAVDQVGPSGVFDPRFQVTCIERGGSGCVGERVYILFNRPNFDARFFDEDGDPLPSSVGSVVISIGQRGAVGSARQIDKERQVTITSSGQISVQ